MRTAFPMLTRCFERQWAGLTDDERATMRDLDVPGYLGTGEEPQRLIWAVVHDGTLVTVVLMSVKAL